LRSALGTCSLEEGRTIKQPDSCRAQVEAISHIAFNDRRKCSKSDENKRRHPTARIE